MLVRWEVWHGIAEMVVIYFGALAIGAVIYGRLFPPPLELPSLDDQS